MMGKTHTAIGMASVVILSSDKIIENLNNIVPIITITSLASILPDIDKKGSTISNKINKLVFNILFYSSIAIYVIYKTKYFNNINISSTVNDIQVNSQFIVGLVLMTILIVYSKLTEHRSFTHSILGVILYSLSFALINKGMLHYFIIGYIMHLVADFFTDKGIEILYPIRKKFNFHLISTKSLYEYLIRYGCYAVLLLIMAQQIKTII